MHYIEIGLGISIGFLLFLFQLGIDIIPLLFVITLISVAVYLNDTRTAKKSFATNDANKDSSPLISFEDIGGQEVAKKELRESLEFLTDVSRLTHLGIRPLKGVLLNGPPGTGKTLLATAAAQFMDSVFIAASGSDFVEMYVGVGAKRIRELFAQAKTLAKKQQKDCAVIFIDELDVLGGKRGQATGNLEYDQTLNELLVQMDGLSFDDNIRLLVIGATNRIDMLDSALLRPGRFDRQVKVDLPSKEGRLHILKLHTKAKPLAENVSLEKIATDTFGFSGAHLESLTNEAAILALRNQENKITVEHFQSAIDKVIMGEKLDRVPSPLELKRIAIHEAGHAIISEYTKPGSVATINIVSRSNALGYVRQTDITDHYLQTLSQIKGKIAVALAGAIAEEIMLGTRSTGASNDFKQATDLATSIINNGMSTLGIISIDHLPTELVHRTLTTIIEEREMFVHHILQHHQTALQVAITALLEKESISGDDFRLLIKPFGFPE